MHISTPAKSTQANTPKPRHPGNPQRRCEDLVRSNAGTLNLRNPNPLNCQCRKATSHQKASKEPWSRSLEETPRDRKHSNDISANATPRNPLHTNRNAYTQSQLSVVQVYALRRAANPRICKRSWATSRESSKRREAFAARTRQGLGCISLQTVYLSSAVFEGACETAGCRREKQLHHKMRKGVLAPLSGQ